MIRNPSAPTHLTIAQAHRVLAREGVRVAKVTIYRLAKPGKPLEGELHEGTLMVPAHRVLEFIEARQASDSAPAPDASEPGPEPGPAPERR